MAVPVAQAVLPLAATVKTMACVSLASGTEQSKGLGDLCQKMIENGEFDPALCPLLQNLSPEEIAERLKEPGFQACMARSSRPAPRAMARAVDVAPPCLEAA